jgi:hypothetical protein
MLRHHHIPIDTEIELDSDTLQRAFECLPAGARREQWTAMVARERNEVTLSGLVKSYQTRRHGISLRLESGSSKTGSRYPTQAQKQGLNGAPSITPGIGEFPLFLLHFHSRKLLQALAFALVKSTIGFSGRVIFQRRGRTNSSLRESVTRLSPGNWKRTAVGKLLQRVRSRRVR